MATRLLAAILLSAAAALGQVVGAPYPAFQVNPPLMFQYGAAVTDGSGFLNSYAIGPAAPLGVAAWCAQSLALAPTPFAFPLGATSSGHPIYLDLNALVGPVEPMVQGPLPGRDWNYVRAIPADPTLVGVTVYTQCAILLTDGTWSIPHAWTTTIQ